MWTLLGRVAGIVIFLLGAVALILSFFKPMHTTMEWYAQVFGLIISGAMVFICAPFINKLKELIHIPKIKSIKEIDVAQLIPVQIKTTTQSEGWSFLIDNYDHLDILSKQLTKDGDEESVKLCRELQKRLLELHHANTIKINNT